MIFHGLYLVALLVSLMGLLTIDLRLGFAIKVNAARTSLTLVIATLFFLAWDLAGISRGIFFEGNPDLMVGIDLTPNLPIEEIAFLLLFNYSILIGYLGLSRLHSKRGAK